MNNIYSQDEWSYRPRIIASHLGRAAKRHPVIVLTGARQVGKSTLLQEEAPFRNWRHVTLDDMDALGQARSDPRSVWSGTNRVVIDEVQRAPEVLAAVKKAVDESRRRIGFVLSGSANLMLMRDVSESLAGRAVTFGLHPMTVSEAGSCKPSTVLDGLFMGRLPRDAVTEGSSVPLERLLHRGFMPPVLELSPPDAVQWWEGYVSTYLERDLRQLSRVSSLPDFRRLMTALALRTGQVLNQSEVARDVGLKQPTAHRYMNLLETSMVLVRLPAFARNRTKRIVKSPKIHWMDPGLAAFLCSHHAPEDIMDSREAGCLFEALVLLQLQVMAETSRPRARIHYWRTTGNVEVDFVLERGRRIVALEVKLSRTPRYGDTAGLREFLRDYPEAVGVLVHSGDDVRRMGDRLVALPWHVLA